MTTNTQSAQTPATTTTTSTPTQTQSGGASPGSGALQMKQALRGMGDFAQQAEALTPAENVQRQQAPGADVAQGADAQAPAAQAPAAAPLGTASNPDTERKTDGSDASAVIAAMKGAFTTLASLKPGDAQVVPALNQILKPQGVTVPALAPGDTRGVEDVGLDAVRAVMAATRGKIATPPMKISPDTLPAVMKINAAFTAHRNLHQNTPHPDEQYRGDLEVLNHLFGVEQLLLAWKERGTAGPTGRTPNAGGSAAVGYALSLANTVRANEPDGSTIQATDRNGKTVDMKPCKGYQLLRTVISEGMAPSYVSVCGGEAVLLDPHASKPSWCGIFANWALLKAGLSSKVWDSGGGGVDYKDKAKAEAKDPKSKIAPADPQPGDMGYMMSNKQHETLIVRASGGTVVSIDGNTDGGGGASGGKIMANSRALTDFTHIFQWK